MKPIKNKQKKRNKRKFNKKKDIDGSKNTSLEIHKMGKSSKLDNIVKPGNASMRKKAKGRLIEGVLDKTRGGFAFLKQEDGQDIFIGKNHTGNAMDGDMVEVELLPKPLWRRNPEGFVTAVLGRKYLEIAGRFEESPKFGFVVQEGGKADEDIFVKKANFNGAEDGDMVLVKIIKYPMAGDGPEGKVIEVIAKEGEAGSDIKALIRGSGLNEKFPPKVDGEARKLAEKGINSKEIKEREDLRKEHIITIDGSHSKDLDDGVSLKILKNGNYELGVHIADVSHYVTSGSYLDQEALERGNSVYLINRVVPMLPKSLSNGICSLNPGEDRLTLTCQMEINAEGNVVDSKIFQSIINSKGRLLYDDVSDLLEGRDKQKELDSAHGETLRDMEKLAILLMSKRKKEGSLDFDFDESEIELDKNGIPQNIYTLERRIGNRMIEEFMLIANETVAETYFWMKYPFVYRVHEKPDPDKIMELKTFLKGLGINLPINPDNVHPKALNNLLDSLADDPRLNVVSTVILRSMKKAYYSTECLGHYGLAFKYYCHFTSPIRRYPDLMIHRIIKAHLNGEGDPKKLKHFWAQAEEAAKISSATERQAQQLERKVEKIKKAQYMEKRIGEEYEGFISGITAFGIYVQLQNTVEGLVKINNLKDDYYNFDEKKYVMVGETTGKTYSMGEGVRIEVLDADHQLGRIDFIMTE